VRIDMLAALVEHHCQTERELVVLSAQTVMSGRAVRRQTAMSEG
jgi:hypothetical protein